MFVRSVVTRVPTHTHTLSLAHTHTHTHTCASTRDLSLAHTHIHTHTHTHTHTHIHIQRRWDNDNPLEADTMLHVAAQNGMLKCVRLLLVYKADPNVLDQVRGRMGVWMHECMVWVSVWYG